MRLHFVLAAAVLLAASLTSWAQSPVIPPVPTELGFAHTAFLGYAGAGVPGGLAHDAVAMLYSSAWRSLSQNSGYRLTPSASNADLLLDLSVQYVITDVINGNSFPSSILRLSVYDSKTHALLWTLDEGILVGFRKKGAEQHVDEATQRLSADLKQLSQGKLP